MAGAVDHSHCKICGRVAAPGEETCSKACRTERARRLESKRGYTYLMYGLIALIAILFVLSLVRA
ncbi:MAG TPA: DUF2116 family Zn-ribbon domain-containing protein [Thermoplasmata archaeon]|nr:DUF2116 family Zn-ribbon domain-containing protein [Thermoplasmata archaeon]